MSNRNLAGAIIGRANRLSASLMRTRTVRMVNEEPIVSFSFDDFPKSAVVNGASILERNRVAGTYYMSRCFGGTTVDGMNYYDLPDLTRLAENGHEIGCHTASHQRATEVARPALIADIEANARFLKENLGDVRMRTFAFPFGDIDLATKLLLQARFAACRSTLPGANHGIADLGALRAERLYSRLTSPQAVQALIQKSARPRTWLIFYTHDVGDQPSPYGCTPALFESALTSALDSGCRVLTVRNALGLIRFRQ